MEDSTEKRFSPDCPISKTSEDKFQRKHFAERIGQAILAYKRPESIVMGIYGEWGSGKSSVLNMIESHLTEIETNNMIIIRFNPWRFSDENSLLHMFFKLFTDKVAPKVDKTQLNWHQKESLGKHIQEYADLLAYTPIPGASILAKTAGLVGSALQKTDIESVKCNLEESLKNIDKKVLIIIDDIDRLDKNEIYSLLRLVKLNANFPNTVYLLSFDEEMVAEAIGERFGKNCKESGRGYLEKIIQIPLHLPKILSIDIQNYCKDEIRNVLNSQTPKITDEEVKEFFFYFNKDILPYIKTPRFAIRYVNAIQFTLPLLNGEVNISDLLLIEAIKVFYPDYYAFIRSNQNLLLPSNTDRQISTLYKPKLDEKKEEVKLALERLSTKYENKERSSILKILKYLFPFIEEGYSNVTIKDRSKEWLKSKRIFTFQYHDRYFLYTVLKGELPDVWFNYFINNIYNLDDLQCSDILNDYLQNSYEDDFLSKLNVTYEDLPPETLKRLSVSICAKGSLFDSRRLNKTDFYDEDTYARLVIRMEFILQKNKQSNAELIFEKADTIEFILSLWNQLSLLNEDELTFSKAECNKLASIMIERVKKGYSIFQIFENKHIILCTLFDAWKEIDAESCDSFIKEYLDQKPEKVLHLITETASTSTVPGSGVINVLSMNRKQFDYIKKIYDLDYLCECIHKAYPNTPEIPEITASYIIEDNLDFLSQFMSFYHLDKTNRNPD